MGRDLQPLASWNQVAPASTPPEYVTLAFVRDVILSSRGTIRQAALPHYSSNSVAVFGSSGCVISRPSSSFSKVRTVAGEWPL